MKLSTQTPEKFLSFSSIVQFIGWFFCLSKRFFFVQINPFKFICNTYKDAQKRKCFTSVFRLHHAKTWVPKTCHWSCGRNSRVNIFWFSVLTRIISLETGFNIEFSHTHTKKIHWKSKSTSNIHLTEIHC